MDKTTLDKFEIIKADITNMKVDAIVNSAHKSYLAGSGLCGAIHRAAGKGLEVECKKIKIEDYPEGMIPMTEGFELPAKYVFHAVIPVAKEFGKISESEKADIRKIVINTIDSANAVGVKTLAFPSLGTGIRAYPLEDIAPLLIKTILERLNDYVEEAFEKIYLVTYTNEDQDAYKVAFNQYINESNTLLK